MRWASFLPMRIKFLVSIVFAVLLAASLTQAENAPAAPLPAITVRGGVHSDFDRLVFDWPRRVHYHITREDAHIHVAFDGAGRADFHEALIARLTRAHDFSAGMNKEGNLVVSFAVDPKAKLRDFFSDNSIVIDISGGASLAANKEEKSQEKGAQSKEAVQKTAPGVSSPAAGTSPSSQPGKVTNFTTGQTSDTAAANANPAPSGAGANQAASPSPLPDLGLDSQLIASLDPHIDARAAVYARAGYGYIIFDHKFTLTPEQLEAGQPAPRVMLEPLDLPKASGFRFALPLDAELHATRQNTVWQIYASKQHVEIPVSTALVAQPDFALGARFLLPLPDAPEPINFTDPVVGDNLIIVPLGQMEAFSIARRMADFRIIPAAQGLVLKPINDKLVVHVVTDGIEITAAGGLHLSPPTDTGASAESAQKAKAAAEGKSIFDFSAWRGKPNETFTDTRQRLMQTIVDVPEAERNRAVLELARFYFANGNGPEAAALLHMLALQVPDLSSHADFLALSGAAKILAYHADDGLADLSAPSLQGEPEIELWQAIGAAELRDWTTAEEKFAVTQSILAGYPEPFYSRFSILSVESALAVNKDREAKDWLDRLENGQHRPEIDPAIEYLHGVIHSKAGRAAAAAELWKEVAASDDRLYQVRAELALVDLGVATGTLTPAKAADRLEGLRFAWRGDDLEFDILHRLGDFYIQAKNFKAGLNTLTHAIELYPKNPLVPQVRTEMAQIFHDIFLGTLAPDLPPLDAMLLYQQYHDLMPEGADGIAIMRNLAERLVAIDLLDQAAELLDDLVKNRLTGIDKGKVGARLAAIRLLDHKPDLAIAALDESDNNSYPPDLLAERLLLRARALSETGKSDEAMELLKTDTSRDATILRADISMRAQHWGEAAKNLLILIGSPPKDDETLTKQQADWLVTCAIAMSLASDQDGLNKLALDFSAAMATMPQNDTFRVLTQPDKPTELKDIAAAQAKISDVDMFRGFLDAYRTPQAGDKAASGTPQPAAAGP